MQWNRHGVIAGSTGTGKTVTMMKLVEELHEAKIPVMAVDIKGDVKALYNLSKVGTIQPYDGFAPLTSVNPTILSKLLNLNDTQTAVLVKIMREEKPEDWNALTQSLEGIDTVTTQIILRNMIFLERMEDIFTSTPAFSPSKLMEGTNVFDATKLQHQPEVYATLMIILIDHLYKTMPEVGNKNKLVIIIDEAHLLFSETSPRILQMLERQIRLIRSKGVGVWFATQSITDIPEEILTQIGTRYQHGMRAYTTKEQAKLRATAGGFRTDVARGKLAEEIQELKTGEVYFSTLGEDGQPTKAKKIKIDLPTISLIPPTGSRETKTPKAVEYSAQDLWDGDLKNDMKYLKRGLKYAWHRLRELS